MGIVVPTLGQRDNLLESCLRSIRAAGDAHICLVAPSTFKDSLLKQSGLIDSFVEDPGTGLAAAIHAGMLKLPKSTKFVNWLGDDDLLEPGSLDLLESELSKNEETVMAFGGCKYIDESGREIWVNRSGRWAARLLANGPDLIPQPSVLFTLEAYKAVGGLSSHFNFAFDYDLFLKLSKEGHLTFLPQILASFRWHSESLTVSSRKQSVEEAYKVRQSNRSPALRMLAKLWEPAVKFATLVAGEILTRRISNRRS